MASSALNHSLFSPVNSRSPISNRTLQTPSLALPRKQFAASFGSSFLSTHSNLTHKSFIVSCNPPDKESTNQELPIELRYPAFPTVMDINQIREILPHRFPFLLVDRVIEYKPGESAVAIKNVTINDNFFPGHFPDRPIMPGVLMVEAMAQVGGLVMLQPEVGAHGIISSLLGLTK